MVTQNLVMEIASVTKYMGIKTQQLSKTVVL